MLSIDPKNTRVVLIGASKFKKNSGLKPLPGVEGNINDLAKVLARRDIAGIPGKNIVPLLNWKKPSDIATRLAQLAREARDTLIVYYSGHGKIGGSPPQLYLATSGTTAADFQFNAISIDWVRKAISQSGAQKKVLILDCCYAGRGLGIMTDESNMIQARLDLKGTYSVAAAPANEEAIAPPGEEHTAFTGELLRVLSEGIDNNKEGISLKDIFEDIRAELQRKHGLPEPQQVNVQDGADLVIAHNTRFAAQRRPPPAIARGLEVLRARIEAANIPPAIPNKTLNLATWNISEFGSKRRNQAAIHYISEIIRQFNIILISEVREDLADFERVKQLLGPHWGQLFTPFNTDLAGNRERIAYLYDQRFVSISGLVGAHEGPRKKNKRTGKYEQLFQWWRSPYIAAFSTGNFDFVILTAHVRWSPDSHMNLSLAEELATWAENLSKEKNLVGKDIILIGDFNIPIVDDDFFQAITSKGLTTPKSLRIAEYGSELARNKRYDQILHYRIHARAFADVGGVLDFYCGDWRALFPDKRYPHMSKKGFTYQLSDHLPLWVQIDLKGTG